MMGLLDQLNEVLLQTPKRYWGDKATRLGSLLSDSASTGAQAYGSANSPMAPEHSQTLAGLLADFTPGVGDVKSAYDGMNAAREGDYLGAALGGLGALPLVPNLAGMFIGKGAKTWDAVNASRAMEMEQAGIDPRKIWSETGNWKGPDGHWRQEIPDNELTLKNVPINKNWEQFFKEKELKEYGKRGAQVSDMDRKSFSAFKKFRKNAENEFNSYNRTHRQINEIVQHDPLYSAYPDLEHTGAMWRPSIGKDGEYSRGTISFGDTSSDVGLKSLFGHELQHAIQQREGFARGGAPSDMLEEALKMLRRDVASGEISRTEDAMSMLPMAQLNAYKRIAGEAEARATQARMNMDAAQRRNAFPADSYDVPLNSLIIRK